MRHQKVLGERRDRVGSRFTAPETLVNSTYAATWMEKEAGALRHSKSHGGVHSHERIAEACAIKRAEHFIGSARTRRQHPEAPARSTASVAIGRDWFWGALAGAAAVGLIWAARARSRTQTLALPELPLASLEALATESELTGPQAALIVRRLQTLESNEMDAIRKKLLLLGRSGAGGESSDVEITEPDPGTPEGRQLLGQLATGANSVNWDQFVEDRLGELLLVTCPTCRAMLRSLWLRPNVGCPSCHHRFSIHESPVVTVCLPPRCGSRGSIEKA